MRDISSMQNIFFLGIGGVGMSALAKYFKANGKNVSGYDRTATVLTREMEASGISVFYDDDIALLPQRIDTVIYTPAVPVDSVLRKYFLDEGLPMYKRAEILGIIGNSIPTVAIAGTHGKTTTTAIITHLLHEGGLPVTAFVGGIMSGYHSNYIHTGSEIMVAEADEFDRSFLQLAPEYAVVLSMDPDHLDIYGDEDQFTAGFKMFIDRIKDGGLLIINGALHGKFSEEEWVTLKKRVQVKTFGRLSDDIYVSDIQYDELGISTFNYHFDSITWDQVQFTMPGHHNVTNAAIAISIALELGMTREKISAALLNFNGIHRRFEFVLRQPGSVFIDDYAHHPTELKAAIDTAKNLFPQEKIMGVFQPHLYSRTRDFASGFAAQMDRLDYPVLLDIYPAREKPISGINANLILDQMNNPEKVIVDYDQLANYVSEKNPAILMTLGAGDIDVLVPALKKIMSEKNQLHHG